MPQKTSDTHLNPKQLRTLEILLSGGSITEAASAVGIDRATTHRWLKTYAFQAAYNGGLLERREAVGARMSALAERAATVVEEALERGDPKVALAVLRGQGYLPGTGARPASDDPTVLERQAEETRAKEEIRAQRLADDVWLSPLGALAPPVQSS
jgi:transposase-like protein